jgi:hypothetical protein
MSALWPGACYPALWTGLDFPDRHSSVMCSALPRSLGTWGLPAGTLALGFLASILPTVGGGCGGRVPPLFDAATRARVLTDAAPDAWRPTDLTDAAPDARRPADAATGSGGAPGNLGTGGSSRLGGAGGNAGTTASCTGVVPAKTTRQSADVLLVLDRSGSMNRSITGDCSCDPTSIPSVACPDTSDCTTRWASLATALDSSLSSTSDLHWGLKLFASPNARPCEVTSGVEVPLGADAAAAIQAEIAAITPAGETPTAQAITEATAYLRTVSDANRKTILLVTDGKPNCAPTVYEDDVEGTIEAITAALDAGFLVYVVGIGPGASSLNLDSFAQAGGTGAHYPAQSPDGLTRALDSISAAATCAFLLDALPPDPSWVGVYLDKNIVPHDVSHGWTFGPTPQTVLLHGSYCDEALADPPATVEALFGCGFPLPTTLP